MWWSTSKPPAKEGFLRTASPNECRCIARESLGFYGGLLVGGTYEFSAAVEVGSISTYTHALRQCLDCFPPLGSIVVGKGDKSTYFKSCPRLDLAQHVQILERYNGEDEARSIQEALPDMVNVSWPRSTPAWKVTVIAFSQQRCFIGFSLSHSLGDGMSGVAFHRQLLCALQELPATAEDVVYTSPPKQLAPPFDTPANLPISWSFLLAPLLGSLLPKRVATLFGLGAGGDSVTDRTWTASPLFYNPNNHRTGVEMVSIDATTLDDALRICRMHNAKLTGLLHRVIINAMSESFPDSASIDTLAARTPLNMRGPVGRSNDEMGNFILADTQVHAIQKSDRSQKNTHKIDWESARDITNRLAMASTVLQNQSLGLLRYLSDVHAWVSSRVGERRDCSYELSNLTSFRPMDSGPIKERCAITEMVFCQPADVLGAPLNFNVVSVANGPMTISVTWQIGALGLSSEQQEVDFVHSICQGIKSGFAHVA